LVAAAKFLVAATKNVFVVPNFVAVTKPFCSVFYREAERSDSEERRWATELT